MVITPQNKHLLKTGMRIWDRKSKAIISKIENKIYYMCDGREYCLDDILIESFKVHFSKKQIIRKRHEYI